jgi:GNAT superfamily N-acetyltransferase
VRIREGQIGDLPRTLELIKELAVFERAPDAVKVTVKDMERDGFGPNPLYGFFVAEREDEIVGVALYYYRYSTWKGKCIYLEDVIVTESFRGQGVGSKLFDVVIRKGIEENCHAMLWQVLDWNADAIKFYTEKYNAHLDGEWINCSISRDAMNRRIKELPID